MATICASGFYTVSQKCSTFGLLKLWHTWTDFNIFGRSVTDRVSNQNTPPQITRASVLPGKTGRYEHRIFHSYAVLMHCQNSTCSRSVAAWFLQSFWLTTHTHAAISLHKSYNKCVQLGAVKGMVQEKGSRERCSSWTVLHTHNAPVRCLPERKKSSVMCVW